MVMVKKKQQQQQLIKDPWQISDWHGLNLLLAPSFPVQSEIVTHIMGALTVGVTSK